MTLAVHALSDRDVVLPLLKEPIAVGDLRRGTVVVLRDVGTLPRRDTFPWPPVGLVGLAIERALTGHRDVLGLEGVNQRRVVHHLDAFPLGVDDRIFRRI